MVSYRFSALLVILFAAVYQKWLKEVLFVTLGVGRVILPIESFPYECQHMPNRLEGCGDMWLDEENRVLYAACTGIDARMEWNPSLSKYNVSARLPTGSDLMAIYIDKPGKDGQYRMNRILPANYGDGPGDGHLDIASFDVEVVDASTIRFWILNQRPTFDSEGKMLDAEKVGANTTVDVYEHKRGDRKMTYKKMTYIGTGKSPKLHSPNKIAFLGANNFVVSNDRSAKVGWRKKLDPLLGGGTLVYYDDWFDVYATTPKKFPIPGHMVRGHDDRIYVPSIVDGKIRLFELQEDRMFKHVHSIDVGMPIMSITLDSNEDFWAVGRTRYDPIGRSSSSAIFKIERFVETRNRYVTTKLIEDKEARFLSGASVARHDAKTGRIFVGGNFTPFVTICERKS